MRKSLQAPLPPVAAQQQFPSSDRRERLRPTLTGNVACSATALLAGTYVFGELNMAKVLIPTPLRQYAEKKDAVEGSGATGAEALGSLVNEHPDLRRQLYTDEGKVRSFVNVALNDEDIRYLKKDRRPVSDGDVISIVPSIAGGAAVETPPMAPPVTLSNEEILRYSRHLIMPEVGMEGQLKLKGAKV